MPTTTPNEDAPAGADGDDDEADDDNHVDEDDGAKLHASA